MKSENNSNNKHFVIAIILILFIMSCACNIIYNPINEKILSAILGAGALWLTLTELKKF